MDFFSVIFSIIASAFLLAFALAVVLIVRTYFGKSIGNPKYPPVGETVFHQLFYINTLFDHLSEIARKHPTFRVLSPDETAIYTTDVRNIEYILKTNFSMYPKGKFDIDVFKDLLGEGIFAVNGDRWRQQRKLASLEFTTRVLRDFSCAVFRRSAAKLVGIISRVSKQNDSFDIHLVLVSIRTALKDQTLRLYPAVPLDGRAAEEDNILPDGYKVNKGESVNYLAYTMGRMPNLWGDDAEEFRPERWLDQNGVFQPESPFKFISFHAGPRICLGKDFAYRQMKIVSITLVRYFKFKMGDETRKVTYRPMLTLHIDGGLHVQVVPRIAVC